MCRRALLYLYTYVKSVKKRSSNYRFKEWNKNLVRWVAKASEGISSRDDILTYKTGLLRSTDGSGNGPKNQVLKRSKTYCIYYN